LVYSSIFCGLVAHFVTWPFDMVVKIIANVTGTPVLVKPSMFAALSIAFGIALLIASLVIYFLERKSKTI